METLLAAYILVWPVISAVVLAVICRAFIVELLEARTKGSDLV
jgi:hypothetical protein